MRNAIIAALTMILLAAGAAAARPLPANIRAAIHEPLRPAADVAAAAERKPAVMLQFADIRPGMRVMDMIPGGGYFTRLFATAVGPKGRVYSFQPSELDSHYTHKPPPINAVAAEYHNVSVVHASINELAAPQPLDVVWTSRNYHDLKDPFFAPADTAKVDKAVFDALRPGGIFVVLDHSAAAGSGIADTNTLHRIDEAVVKKEVEAAGFRLVAESNALRNPKDTRTLKVFDPAIRGHTDQFILKFRKPRS